MRKMGNQGIQKGFSADFVLLGEDQDEHNFAFFRSTDEHIAEKAVIFPDIVEFIPVFYAELLDKQANSIAGFRLQMAFFDIQDFVEEFAHVEAQTHAIFFGNGSRILVPEQPAFVGSAEFQLVTIVLNAFRGECGPDFRHLQMAYAHQLVFHLLAFGFQLHSIGQRLPSTTATDAKMLAERL